MNEFTVIRKKFKCPYCSFSAMHQCILKRHMRSHTGERPYPCEICGKKFTRREHMKRHTLVSAGVSQCMRVYDKMVSDVLTGRSGVGCRLPTPVIGALQKGVWNRTGRAATHPPPPPSHCASPQGLQACLSLSAESDGTSLVVCLLASSATLECTQLPTLWPVLSAFPLLCLALSS